MVPLLPNTGFFISILSAGYLDVFESQGVIGLVLVDRRVLHT